MVVILFCENFHQIEIEENHRFRSVVQMLRAFYKQTAEKVTKHNIG